MDDTLSALAPWLILFALYGLPLLHVALSRRGGGWRPPAGSRCPFGPRAGWLVMVLMLGPVGWLMFALRRPRSACPAPPAGRGNRAD
ncbi:hypothetical protein [Azospirillum sp. TSO35-2]|uniref:hypothetical protein n=1 Tax=Azospirillum sp. TSO35-2 TaxID=716796 RepID=UPI000D610BDC|nr:hypothetical protein [Azospirillum sp. TSO35-2]PWC33749.1 hypothetical protein TSO352_25515 [Azospirillum sp. TSO35-2]